METNIKGIAHVGLYVNDMQRSVRFYEDGERGFQSMFYRNVNGQRDRTFYPCRSGRRGFRV